MNKVALITGSSRGIGKLIAYKFAKEGYDIILNCSKNEDMVKEIQLDLMATYNINCLYYVCDVSDYSKVKDMFNNIYKSYKSLDVVVNNAGISHFGLFSELREDEWDSILNTNLKSIFNVSKFAIPPMVSRRQGIIINISSIWGITGASCEVAYSASKGGVNSLTKALAKELAPSNVRVNAIACGVIDTDMNRWLTSEERDVLCQDIPMSRFGKGDEVANLCHFLASNESSYLTGQVITLDGGMI